MATTQVAQPIHPVREILQIAVLVVLAILLVTQDLRGPTPYALLGISALVAWNGYRRTRPRTPTPWECNDE